MCDIFSHFLITLLHHMRTSMVIAQSVHLIFHLPGAILIQFV